MGGGDQSPILPVIAHREQLLTHLSRHAATKRDLVAELDQSRSTVDRAITELERYDLIECADRTYRTTLAGELALEELERFASRVRHVADARELLESLPAEASLSPALFEDCEVVTTGTADSRTVPRDLEQTVRRSNRLRLFACGYHPSLIDEYAAAIEDGTPVDVAVTETVLDRLLNDHRSTISTGIETDRIDLRVATHTLPFNLSIVRTDDESIVTIEVYENEQFLGLVATEKAAGVEWGRTQFQDIWAAASPLFLGDD